MQASEGRVESGSTTRGSASKRERSYGLGTPPDSEGVSPPRTVGLVLCVVFLFFLYSLAHACD